MFMIYFQLGYCPVGYILNNQMEKLGKSVPPVLQESSIHPKRSQGLRLAFDGALECQNSKKYSLRFF